MPETLPVSFFLPCYRCTATVEASVASILNGNLGPDDEVVMVEDGSGDGTLELLQRLAARDPRLRLVRHERNRGGAAARNTAVREARHGLLFCLDSDNLLSPGSVPALRTFLQDRGLDAAAFGEIWFFQHALPRVTHRWVYRDVVSLPDCFAGFVVPPASGNYLFTRASWERAGGYPEDAGALDAWGFGFRQLATGSRMATLPGAHYLHRYGHESYWVRDSRDGKISALAAAVVAPFAARFSPEALQAMQGEATRKDWFESLETRPLALPEGPGLAGRVDRPFPRWWQRPFLWSALRGQA
jgi:glycosyltransferase involved in cell wall biosynthesis